MSRAPSSNLGHFARLLIAVAAALSVTTLARAQTGVSEDRVALPDGPGSIGGVGENVSVSDNMGLMSYGVAIEVPQGFAGVTPELSIAYNSGGGNGELGIGWDLTTQSIERTSVYGLPRYDTNDVFAENGSEELVRVKTGSTSHVYRARFERNFVRYTWHSDVAGKAGYFEAEYPDGSRGFFGADASGQPVESAQVVHPNGGVFRYLLVDKLDRFGHRMHHAYRKVGDTPLLDSIGYVYRGDSPRYQVKFSYEGRSDVLSSALSLFELVLDQRLRRVEVFHGSQRLRYYDLSYEETGAGTSRLIRVEQFGLDGSRLPIAFSFAYSESSLSSCAGCALPKMHDMGLLSGGVDLRNGRATLVDINGDALPDLLDTGSDGAHRFFLNALDPHTSQQSFSAEQASARTVGGSSFVLSKPGVQVLDINGDGLADMIDAAGNQVLCNDGSGDWASANYDCGLDVSIDGLELGDTGEADPLHVRFFDYDHDRRVDLMRTVSNDETQVLRNTASGFVADPEVSPVGSVFDDGPLQLGDINGDGLLDAVEVTSTGVLRYRLNLGRAQWAPWVERHIENASVLDLQLSDLQDLNGDGLDDLVVVLGDSVKFALNQAQDFLPMQALTTADVDGGLPVRHDATVVLFADMNGSGTTDVVWVDQGHVRFLELFAVRPNLLTRIDNGIGAVQTVEYGTSSLEQARDEAAGMPWRQRLPEGMNVVKATESIATLTPELKDRVEYVYHHGYSDGHEKRYRGFAVVEEQVPADPALDSQEPGLTILDFDVGAESPYYNGLLVRSQVFGGPADARYRVQRELRDYDECALADVPSAGLSAKVVHVCLVSTETLLQEDRPEAEWTTLRTEQRYDGYGNVTWQASYGVTGMGADGSSACAPCTAPAGTSSGACGEACLGDEAFTETAYITPGDATGGRWFLHEPYRTVHYGKAGGAQQEELVFYDGKPFVGASLGTMTVGNVSRQCARVTKDAAANCEGAGWVMPMRASYDAHGNPVDMLDALGAATDDAGHRRKLEYDADGLKATAAELLLSKDGSKYRLRREMTYDSVFDLPAQVTRWMLVGAPARSEPAATLVAYDAFGRRSAIAQPGDSLAAPTTAYTYSLSAPVSQIVVRARSQAGKDFDLEQRRCVDGRGRDVQTRTRLAEGSYQITGFNEVNRRGEIVRSYQPYQSTSSACDGTAPKRVAYVSHRYDGLGRALSVTLPDASLYGTPSVLSTSYAPLQTIERDAEDNDPMSAAYGTPHITRVDGLGRVVALERWLGSPDKNGEVGRITALYDDLGRLTGYLDPTGHRKAQRFDLLGRVVHVDDPNAGATDFVYDAAGNLLQRSDARHTKLALRYDGANRVIEEYDAADESGTRVDSSYDFAASCGACTFGEGQLVAATYPLGEKRGTGRDEYGFDVRGHNVLMARTLEGHRFETRFAFDNAGRLTGTTQPDGQLIVQHYDPASRLVAIDGVLTGISYDERGLATELAYANGIRTEHEFDTLARPSQAKTHGKTAGEVLEGFGYTRNRVGDLLAIEDLSSSRPVRPEWDAHFRYDAWYRLREADRGSANGERESFAFDSNDNIVRRTLSLPEGQSGRFDDTYAYDAAHPNAVSALGDLAYRYDAAGYLTRRAQVDLTWDHEGRLRAVTGPDGKAEYAYARGPERVLEIDGRGVTYFLNPNFELRDGIGVSYARVGRERVARSPSKVLASEVLDDLAPKTKPDGEIGVGDAWLKRVAGGDPTRHLRSAARRVLLDNAPATVFLHHDHLGSTTLATDAQGAVVGERAFDATGNLRAEHGYVDAYGFTGQRVDEHSGLLHFMYRELDTSAARWASPDPLFGVASAKLLPKWGESTTGYAYVANAPVDKKDSTGLVILDSNVVGDLMKGDGALAAKVIDIAAHPDNNGKGISITETVLAEMNAGIANATADDPMKGLALQTAFNDVMAAYGIKVIKDVDDTDEHMGYMLDKQRASLRVPNPGDPPSKHHVNDARILATAMRDDELVLTGDTSFFHNVVKNFSAKSGHNDAAKGRLARIQKFAATKVIKR